MASNFLYKMIAAVLRYRSLNVFIAEPAGSTDGSEVISGYPAPFIPASLCDAVFFLTNSLKTKMWTNMRPFLGQKLFKTTETRTSKTNLLYTVFELLRKMTRCNFRL